MRVQLSAWSARAIGHMRVDALEPQPTASVTFAGFPISIPQCGKHRGMHRRRVWCYLCTGRRGDAPISDASRFERNAKFFQPCSKHHRYEDRPLVRPVHPQPRTPPAHRTCGLPKVVAGHWEALCTSKRFLLQSQNHIRIGSRKPARKKLRQPGVGPNEIYVDILGAEHRA